MTTPVVGPEQHGRVVRGGNGGGTPGNHIDQANLADYWTVAGEVHGLPKQEADVLVEREQATVADAVPLGLAGFAAATFTVGTAYCGWFGASAVVLAIPVALIFGGIGQFLAGMWAFRRGNVLAATAFSTFGAFNASWALLEWMSLNHTFPVGLVGVAGAGTYVIGVFILMFALIAAYLGVAALGENLMIAGILFVLSFTYLALGAGTWIGGANPVTAIGGYAAIIVSLMAFYESAAVVINSGFRRQRVPSFGVSSAPRRGLRMPNMAQ